MSSIHRLPNQYKNPPAGLSLPEGEVHLWQVHLEPTPPDWEAFGQVLSPDEQARAARFHFQADAHRYAAMKTCQRVVLGEYLGLDPARLIFRLNTHGKPGLGREFAPGNLQFNLSHTRGLGLLAVSRGAALGVDVEHLRSREVEAGLARRFFSPREVAALERLPAAEQKRAFYECWTRKEAYIKARGEGLSFPLDQFAVSLGPDQLPALLLNERDPEEPRRWTMVHLELGDEHVGALVIAARSWIFRQYRWPGSPSSHPAV